MLSSSNVRVNTFNFLFFLNVAFWWSKAVVSDNPVSNIIEVVSANLACNQKTQKSANNTWTNGDTEWDESGSEILTGDVPSERVWVKGPVEFCRIGLDGTENSSSQWAQQALCGEDEWSTGCENGSWFDDFFLNEVENRLQKTSNHTQKNGSNNVVNMRSTGTNHGSTGKGSIQKIFDSDSAMDDSWQSQRCNNTGGDAPVSVQHGIGMEEGGGVFGINWADNWLI